MSDVLRQREYYAQTAEYYEAMHVRPDDEHGIAIAAFIGVARLLGCRSVLDVGAGTGRSLRVLGEGLPDARIVGVEPVAALREVGHERGIARNKLINGDALALPFEDGAFDFVVETAVLHHVAEPSKAVAEMLRVARLGVMISDSNNYGQGRPAARRLKGLIRRLRLWKLMVMIQTRGKMSKWSKGDGLYYSYSVTDSVRLVRSKFPRVFMMNTTRLTGFDLRSGADQIALIATKDPH